MDRCDQLADFPVVGTARDEIRPGLRTLGDRRRAVIAFAVTDTTVEIIGVTTVARDRHSSGGRRRIVTDIVVDHGRYWPSGSARAVEGGERFLRSHSAAPGAANAAG